MNIALFHTTLPEPDRKVGGVEAVVHRLANALTTHTAHNVTVFSLTPAPTDALYEHTHLFPSLPALHEQSVLRWGVLPLLLNAVSFRDHDVLHLHGDDWFFVRRGLPTVRTMHGSALEEARTASSWKRRWAQRLIYPLEHIATRLATLPLSIGPHTASLYGIDQLVNNGVDPERFYPGPKASAPRLLFVGTWAGRKRGAFLFDTFVERVLPAVPDATLQMVSDTVSDACRRHPQVEVFAHPSDETLARLYREAWVFASSSVYEGFGLPYVEAMASGTAVVCSPNGGAEYVLDDGAYGAIVEDAEFGATLAHLLTSTDARRSWEEKGRQRAEAFTWAAIARTHETLYERVASGRAALSSSPSLPPASA